MESKIEIYDTPQEVAIAAAELVIRTATMAIRNSGRFSWSLSGGSTPKALFTLLGSDPYISQIDWHNVDIFWGDERCVPFDHPDSDFGMAYDAMLSKISADKTPRIYRMIGELNPQKSAESYEALLQGYFGPSPSASFDLLMLGMGDDGHTASMFPGTAPIHEQTHWVLGHFVPKLAAWRLTFTPPILNLAGQVIFLVTGANKREILKSVREGPYLPDTYPSQIIQPHSRKVTWMVDRAAAGN